MKKFTFKNISFDWKYDFKKHIRDEFNNKEWADKVQNVIDLSILKRMNSGLSPVKGHRNYAKYKDKDKYPGDLKPSNKPNLYLTGKLYGAYKAKPRSTPMEVSIGIHPDETEEIKIIAKANNIGTQNSKGEVAIAARRFVPLKGESYATQIVLEIRKLFATVLGNAIKRGRNK